MSRFPLFDLARDATLAVGAYVGILREHVKAEWATVLGGSFDERVAQARARMEAQADALNEYEAENDGLEGVSGPQPCPDCDGVWLNGVGECPESSPVAEAAVGEPPEVEPSPTAPSGGLASVSGSAPIGDAIKDIFRSGGQTKQFGPRPKISVPQPQKPVEPLTEESLRRVFREEVDRAFDQLLTICEQFAETVSPASLFTIRKK